MKYYTPPFSFIASHPVHENNAVIIDQEGKIVALLVVPTTAPEDVDDAMKEITRIGVAMAEAIK